jgi:pimeloyl-ACP methyl ester carboxylesterase
MSATGAVDWRPNYRKSFPKAAEWITARVPEHLPVERIAAPTLLIWGDADPISPLAVGQHLAQRIAGARLHLVPGGDHDVARTHVDEVAALIHRHLGG